MSPRTSPRRWRPQLTRREQRLGWVVFGLYLLLFPLLVAAVTRALDERAGVTLTPAQANTAYYALVLAGLVILFWDFLRNALRIFRENLRENLFAMAAACLAGLCLTCLAGLVPLPAANPVLVDYPEQFALAPGATVLVAVLLRPAVEEILYRGLLFGSLRLRSRPVAYAVCGGVFALCSVWQHVAVLGPAGLLLAIQYLPLGLALCWCYDVGGSVFAPLACRLVLSGVFLALAL